MVGDVEKFPLSETSNSSMWMRLSVSPLGTVVLILFHFLQKYRMSESEDHLLLFDLVMKMLAYDPVERINLDEALRHPFFDNIPPQYRLDYRL